MSCLVAPGPGEVPDRVNDAPAEIRQLPGPDVALVSRASRNRLAEPPLVAKLGVPFVQEVMIQLRLVGDRPAGLQIGAEVDAESDRLEVDFLPRGSQMEVDIPMPFFEALVHLDEQPERLAQPWVEAECERGPVVLIHLLVLGRGFVLVAWMRDDVSVIPRPVAKQVQLVATVLPRKLHRAINPREVVGLHVDRAARVGELEEPASGNRLNGDPDVVKVNLVEQAMSAGLKQGPAQGGATRVVAP